MTLNFCNSCFAVPGSSPVSDHPINVRGTIASIVRMRIKTKESVSCLIIGTVVDGLDVESSGVAVTFSCLPGISAFSESFLEIYSPFLSELTTLLTNIEELAITCWSYML